MIRAIGNTCQSLSDAQEKIITQREKLLKEVSQATTFDKAVTLVKEYADGVFESLQDLNSSNGQKQGMMAMDYIRKNYMDPDLSLNSICSYLNISTSYFGISFKKMTGKTPTEYAREKRR